MLCFIDFERVFDKVWINGLTFTFTNYEFLDYLTRLITSYLTDRTLQVSVNDVRSSVRPIRGGVFQGSILASCLFNLYINDIQKFLQIKTALYADKTAIYSSSFIAYVATKLDVKLEQWQDSIFIHIFTDITVHSPLKINNITIIPNTRRKYLGVHLEIRLKNYGHIKASIQKSYMIHSLYSFFKSPHLLMD